MGSLSTILPYADKGGMLADVVEKQRQSAALAAQILGYYTKHRIIGKEWEKYRNVCGVILADEVGLGKTFEAFALLAMDVLKNKRCRVLVVAHPAIRKKWETCINWQNGGCSQGDKDKCHVTGKEHKGSTGVRYCDSYDIHKFMNNFRGANSTSRYKKLLRLFDDGNVKVIRGAKQWDEDGVLSKKSKNRIWICSPRNLPKTKRVKIENAWRQSDYFFKDKRFTNCFDWIIVDEAHASKAGYNEAITDKTWKNLNAKNNISKRAIQKITAAINTSKRTKLLLLTATPFQNNESELKALVELLGRGADDDSVAGIVSKGIEKFRICLNEIIEHHDCSKDAQYLRAKINEIRRHLDIDVQGFFQDEDQINTDCIRPKKIRFKYGKNGTRESGLDDFMLDIMIRNRKTKPEIQSEHIELGERAKLHYLLMRDSITTRPSNGSDSGREMFSVRLSQLTSSHDAFIANNKNRKYLEEINGLFDGDDNIFVVKYIALKNLLMDLFAKKELSEHGTVVVFSSFIPTLYELADKLEVDLKGRAEIQMIKGDDPIDRRNKIIQNNNESKGVKRVLLISRVGNEGLDFDKFSRAAIHYDWHYNPGVIDQRNGRIYRRSVRPEELFIYRMFLKETYGQRIVYIQEKKKEFKDFYMGDSTLNKLMKFCFNEKENRINTELLETIKDLRIDLEPKPEYLLGEYRRLL